MCNITNIINKCWKQIVIKWYNTIEIGLPKIQLKCNPTSSSLGPTISLSAAVIAKAIINQK
jgi:hypothetical protein